MNSRERVLACMSRDGSTDRVPIDLGGYQSGICWLAYERLKKELGIHRKTEILELNQMLAVIDEEVLDRFHVDTRYVFASPGKPPNWIDDSTYEDEWGIQWRKPPGSHYYDMVFHPWGEKSKEDIRKAPLPPVNPAGRCKGLRTRALELRQGTDKAIFTSTSSVFEQAWYLMGMESFFMALADDHSLIETVLDRVLEGLLAIDEAVFAEIGDLIDCVQFWGDLGTQSGPLMNPRIWRQLVQPRELELINLVRTKTKARVAWHSCGSCREFIPDLIGMGVDLLNPIQTRAAGMDPFELAAEYGKDISFWGGIDGQEILPLGTARDVKNEVRRLIDAFNGGLLIGGCHNIQNDVPAENIIALFDEAFMYGSDL